MRVSRYLKGGEIVDGWRRVKKGLGHERPWDRLQKRAHFLPQPPFKCGFEVFCINRKTLSLILSLAGPVACSRGDMGPVLNLGLRRPCNFYPHKTAQATT